MEATVLVGHNAFDKGPDGEKSTHGLSPKLQEMGIKILRLKTGTPQRIKASSIDYDELIPQFVSYFLYHESGRCADRPGILLADLYK